MEAPPVYERRRGPCASRATMKVLVLGWGWAVNRGENTWKGSKEEKGQEGPEQVSGSRGDMGWPCWFWEGVSGRVGAVWVVTSGHGGGDTGIGW